MILRKKVSKSSFYTDYVNILNGVLQLSNREAEVFAHLLLYNDAGFESNINHRTVRSNIKLVLGISEANLSRYLNTIKIKGLIVKGKGNKWVINDNIKPDVIDDTVEITFSLKVNNDTGNKETAEKAITGVYTQNIDS